MAEFRGRPLPEGMIRNRIAQRRRADASEYSAAYAAIPTYSNDDESRFADEGYVCNFTKGLAHDDYGQVDDAGTYQELVNCINQQDAQNFDSVMRGIGPSGDASGSQPPLSAKSQRKNGKAIAWRGWESPRSGQYYELQGPDPDAVGMPPAPELGSEELTAEMAEVYALALLRDVPFGEISNPNSTAADEHTGLQVNQVLQAMQQLSWFGDSDTSMLSLQERRRRAARRIDPDSHHVGGDHDVGDPDRNLPPFNAAHAFRGSAPASKAGPYLSQFMLLGNRMHKASSDDGCLLDSSFWAEWFGDDDSDDYDESLISYGRQYIDQKITSFPAGQDFMLHWHAYLDVQNGADFRADTDDHVNSKTKRFITTPRDLAAYVRYDALYQAYLNACLFMLGAKQADGTAAFALQKAVEHPYSRKCGPGFPDGNRGSDEMRPESRQAFAQFGGPHILSLVTEVATRCLKAVRRQKFNYHRRARPERIGALLTLQGSAQAGKDNSYSKADKLGYKVSGQLNKMLAQNGFQAFLNLVDQHNKARLAQMHGADPHLDFMDRPDADWLAHVKNYLLPMAFAEGSPMHPSYGAGHATVAGGCVTMLKAFFHTTDAKGAPLAWPDGLPVLQASADGMRLQEAGSREGMTISGELNKLAANISIGRNMAGVHYYTDYYESLRMGERIATGMLIEQMYHYNEPVEFSFESFDGDHVHILRNDYDSATPRVFVHNAKGEDVGLDNWWMRHVTEKDQAESVADVLFAARTRAPAPAGRERRDTAIG